MNPIVLDKPILSLQTLLLIVSDFFVVPYTTSNKVCDPSGQMTKDAEQE